MDDQDRHGVARLPEPVEEARHGGMDEVAVPVAGPMEVEPESVDLLAMNPQSIAALMANPNQMMMMMVAQMAKLNQLAQPVAKKSEAEIGNQGGLENKGVGGNQQE